MKRNKTRVVESKTANDGTTYQIKEVYNRGQEEYIVVRKGSDQALDEIEPRLSLARDQLDETVRLHNQGYLGGSSTETTQQRDRGGGGLGFGEFGLNNGRNGDTAEFEFGFGGDDFGFGFGSDDDSDGCEMERDEKGRYSGCKDDGGGFFDFLR